MGPEAESGTTNAKELVRKAVLAAALTSLMLAGCGDGGEANQGDGAPTCQPQGDRLSLLARNTAFGTECLAAPADTKFEVQFDNQDGGIQHNVAILSQDAGAYGSSTALFSGQRVQGPAIVTYEVRALSAGTYPFRCEVHPDQMNGMLIVA